MVNEDKEPAGDESPRPAQEYCAEFAARYWREASAFVKQSRQLTSMVRVEPCSVGGVLIIATDGATMAVFRDAEGDCLKAITVPFIALDDARDSSRIRLAPNVVWLVRDGRVVGGAVYPEATYQFPNWRAALPELSSEATKPIFFDPKLIAQCSLDGKALSLTATEPGKPALVCLERDDAFAVIMPVRVNSNGDPFQRFAEWLKPAAKA